MVYVNMGIVHFNMQRWAQAETYFLTAITRYNELNQTRMQVNAMDWLGEVYIASGDYENAKQILTQATALLNATDSISPSDKLHATVSEHLAEANSQRQCKSQN